MSTPRPASVIIATVLLLLLSLFNMSAFVQPDAIRPPLPVLIWALVAGIVGLIAAVGLSSMKHWGWLVTVIVSAVSTVAAVPGIVLAPNAVGKSVSVGLIVGYGLVLVLTVLPATRAAFAAARAHLAM